MRWVEVPFRRSEKNQPAWDFIHSIASGHMQPADGGAVFTLPAERLAALRYEPAQAVEPGGDAEAIEDAVPRSPAATLRAGADMAARIQRIADELSDARRIQDAVDASRLRDTSTPATGANPDSQTLEGRLLNIWRRVLGNPRVGVDDNFFDGGGTSLKAVQTVAAIRRETGFTLPVVTLFECPTVRALCSKLDNTADHTKEVSDAVARGSRRKHRTTRRA
jgi:acyl carrier protein